MSYFLPTATPSGLRKVGAVGGVIVGKTGLSCLPSADESVVPFSYTLFQGGIRRLLIPDSSSGWDLSLSNDIFVCYLSSPIFFSGWVVSAAALFSEIFDFFYNFKNSANDAGHFEQSLSLFVLAQKKGRLCHLIHLPVFEWRSHGQVPLQAGRSPQW